MTRTEASYDVCPTHIKKDRLLSFRKRCSTPSAKHLFAKARSFRRDSVKDWNPNAENVTKTLLMGWVGLDESSKSGCGTAVLDVSQKLGTLVEDGNGRYTLPRKHFSRRRRKRIRRRVYCLGDRKTNENATGFRAALQDRPLSTEFSSDQAEVFLQVTEDVMFLPRHWHTGMNMMQSLNKAHWTTHLLPAKDHLGWNKMAKDASKNYYMSAKIIQFRCKEDSRYLLHDYLSHFHEKYEAMFDDEDLTEADVITQVAVDFGAYLVDHMRNSDDDHVRSTCNFVLMANDFINFVQSYRQQDAIGIERGYHKFAPVFKQNGQVKYVEAVWELWDMAFKEFDPSRTQEYRMNCGVRTYPSSKKGAMPHDEFLEVCNRDLSLLPDTRSATGLSRRGHIVGVTKRCKRSNEAYYNKGEDERSVHRSSTGSKGNLRPEKQMLYEISHLYLGPVASIGKGQRLGRRKLHKSTIANLKPKTELKTGRSSKLVAKPTGSTEHLFNSVSAVYKDVAVSSARERAIAEAEEGEDLDKLMDSRTEVVERELENEMARVVLDNDEDPDIDYENDPTIDDDGVNKLALTDIWSDGWAAIKESKVAQVRYMARKRVERKSKLSRYIVSRVQEFNAASSSTEIIGEAKNPKHPGWRTRTRMIRR